MYYVSRNQQQPVQLDEPGLRSALASGQLLPSDLYWTKGMADWRPLGLLYANRTPQAPSQAASAPTPKQETDRSVEAQSGESSLLHGGGLTGLKPSTLWSLRVQGEADPLKPLGLGETTQRQPASDFGGARDASPTAGYNHEASGGYARPNPQPNAAQAGFRVRSLEPAGRGVRLLAQIIDIAIVGVLTVVAVIIDTPPMVGTTPPVIPGWFEVLFTFEMPLTALVLWGVFAVQVYGILTRGQSLGKRICAIRIVDTGDDTVPNWWQLLIMRMGAGTLLSLIPLLGPLYSLVDSLRIFGGDSRCFHDHLAATDVIKGHPVREDAEG
jgi:uncharacterized RDD family membrane protein YckC